jgi:transposase
LARYGQVLQPPARGVVDAQTQRLQTLVRRRQDYVAMRTMERNRRPHLPADLRDEADAHCAWLSARVQALEAELAALIAANPTWRERDALLQSVPGVGPTLSATLLAEVSELGAVSGKQAAALVGVAPYLCESGRFKGQRRCWGGRAGVRTTLFMATRAGVRCNPVLQATYTRLRTTKPDKVAVIACARKLLVILNAMVRDGTAWTPHENETAPTQPAAVPSPVSPHQSTTPAPQREEAAIA